MRHLCLIALLCATTLADDQYYLVSSNDQNSIRKYALDGTYLGDLVSGDSGILAAPQYMAITPRGNLIVSNFNRSEVHIFDLESGDHIRQFDLQGQDARGMAFLGYAPNGELWISAFNNSRTLRFDGDTEAYLGDAFAQLDVRSPHGVVWRNDGSFIVSAAGQVIAELATVGADPEIFAFGDGLARPLNILPSNDGLEYFVSNFNDRVSRFDLDGNFLGGLSDDTEPFKADGLTHTPEGHVLASFWGTSEIRRYDPKTNELIGIFANTALDGLTQPNDIFLVSICSADFDGDGDADAEDFFAFLDAFVAQDPKADINGDGSFDADDFFAFLDRFAQGCP